VNRVMLLATAGMVAALGVGVASAAGAAPSAPAAHAAKQGPTIVAKPDSVMVNRSTTLTGSGFKPHKKLTIWECSAKFWLVPQQVCNHRNAVIARTNSHGGFIVKMKVLVCPVLNSAVAPAGFSRRCFVGVPTIRGIDAVELVGAVRITVTGP